MEWISTKDRLPEEGKVVLILLNLSNWIYPKDQIKINCVTAFLKKGISIAEREAMPETEERKHEIFDSDQHGNNKVPFSWETFGDDSYNGQDVLCWTEIENIPKEFEDFLRKEHLANDLRRQELAERLKM